MIPSSKFKRMFLIPEITYRDILKKSDNMDRTDLEELNKNHDEKDYFTNVFDKEPKHLYPNKKESLKNVDRKDGNKSDSDADHDKTVNDTSLNDTGKSEKDPSSTSTIQDISREAETPSHSTPNKSDLPTLNVSKKTILQVGTSTTPKDYNCRYCGKHYQRKAAFTSHVEICKSITKYQFKCKVENCRKQYVKKENYEKHLKSKHSDSPLPKTKNGKSNESNAKSSSSRDNLTTKKSSKKSYIRSYTKLVS